jgi:hypothetical protein
MRHSRYNIDATNCVAVRQCAAAGRHGIALQDATMDKRSLLLAFDLAKVSEMPICAQQRSCWLLI